MRKYFSFRHPISIHRPSSLAVFLSDEICFGPNIVFQPPPPPPRPKKQSTCCYMGRHYVKIGRCASGVKIKSGGLYPIDMFIIMC